MTVAVWTLIALLATAQFALLVQVRGLDHRLGDRIGGLADRMNDGFRELTRELAARGEVLAEVHGELTAQRAELPAQREEMAAIREEVVGIRGEMVGIRENMAGVRGELAGVRAEFRVHVARDH
ncbi:hypothetical protein BH24ACT13_BH24ACT13_11590 [soil metagenome]